MDPFSIPSLSRCNELVESSDCFYKKTEMVNDIPITSFTYRLASYSDFNQPYARNMRGITFREDTGKLVAAPFWKFFNYGENPFTEESAVNTWCPTMVGDKLDGSLVYFYELDGTLQAKTKFHCYSGQAASALKYVQNHSWMHDTILDFVGNGYTPMFEYVAPDNQIVLQYNQEDLVYLGTRNLVSGELLESVPREFKNFTQPESYTMTVPDILDYCRHTDQLKEGFVVRFENGELVKFKTRKYLDIFHTLNSIQSSDKYVASLVLHDQLDDLLQIIPEHMKEGVIEKASMIRQAYLKIIKEGTGYYEQNKHLSQKEFAVKAMDELGRGSNEFSVAMGMYTSHFNEEKFMEGFIAKKCWEETDISPQDR